MKKIISITVFLFIYLNDFGQNCNFKSKYFKIDSATKITEYAGVYGGTGSITYEVFFKVTKKGIAGFDSAWALAYRSLVILKTKKDFKANHLYCKNKRYSIIVNIQYNPERVEYDKKMMSPVNCPQELILRYKVKNKSYYLVLSNFTKLSTINLP